MDAIQAIAAKNKFDIQTQEGDMHFINNLAVLHCREGFVDGKPAVTGCGKQKQQRHLVRTWNRDVENGWEVPEALAKEYCEAYEGDGPLQAIPEPFPGAIFPLRSHPN